MAVMVFGRLFGFFLVELHRNMSLLVRKIELYVEYLIIDFLNGRHSTIHPVRAELRLRFVFASAGFMVVL